MPERTGQLINNAMKKTLMLLPALALLAACDPAEQTTTETNSRDTIALDHRDTIRTQGPRMAACCNNEPNTPGSTGIANEGTDGGYANADVAVQAAMTSVVDEGAQWHLHTYINVEAGDDCSAQECTKAIITLPAFSVVDRVVAIGSGGAPLKWRQCKAAIEVELSWLCPHEKGDGIDVWVNKSTFELAKCSPSFGVYAYSSLADSWPNNNYWWWYQRCEEDSTKPLAPVSGPKS